MDEINKLLKTNFEISKFNEILYTNDIFDKTMSCLTTVDYYKKYDGEVGFFKN